jgi:hypothetical protein
LIGKFQIFLARPETRSSTASRAVKTRTGILLRLEWRSPSRARPSPSGNPRSRTAASYAVSESASRASAHRLAESTAKPARLRASCKISVIRASSSMTRMRTARSHEIGLTNIPSAGQAGAPASAQLFLSCSSKVSSLVLALPGRVLGSILSRFVVSPTMTTPTMPIAVCGLQAIT